MNFMIKSGGYVILFSSIKNFLFNIIVIILFLLDMNLFDLYTFYFYKNIIIV